MSRPSRSNLIQEDSWAHCIGQLRQNSEGFHEYLESQYNNFFKDFNFSSNDYAISLSNQLMQGNLKRQLDVNEYEKRQSERQQDDIQPYEANHIEQRHQQNKSKQKSFKRQQLKADVYSRNYREKKKEKMKMLEQENYFLKKKVDQLQYRLRQAELQLHRVKFNTVQENNSIQQLNEDVLNKLNLIVETIPLNKNQNKEYLQQDKKMSEFIKFYNTHGFGGEKTKEALEYYMNEFLQNVMRDREKYYALTCLKKKYLNPEKSIFDLAFTEVFPKTMQQKKAAMEQFMRVGPALAELRDSCRQFYKVYKKIIRAQEKIHEITRYVLFSDIEETKQRLKMVLWFQINQHRKQLRQLRAEWIDYVKNDQADQTSKESREKKKRKTNKDNE